MVYVHKRPVGNYIENPKKFFSNLLFCDIKPYIDYFKLFDITLAGSDFDDRLQLKHVPIIGKFGATTLSNIPMGYIICILSMIAINKKQHVCFLAGLIGENALIYLCEAARGTQYIHLYSTDGRVPSILKIGIFEKELVYVDA